MYSVKQIFLVLALLSVASAKKGISIRGPASELEAKARRGLKKSSKKSSGGSKGGSGFSNGSFTPPRTGDGGVAGGTVDLGNGVNRDGTAAGSLIEPAGKPCIPFDESTRYLTEDYPGDVQCRTAGGADSPSSACCRLFSFADAGGSQKWLLFDSNNQYPDLVCVCNANTSSGSDSGAVVVVPPVSTPTAPVSSPTADRTGDTGGDVVVDTTPSGGAVCSSPNPTQLDLQSRPGVTACVTNTECGGDSASKCCSVDTCICYPKSFLDASKCIPAA